MKPILYYKTQNGIPFDNFCSDSAIGARESGIEAIGFEYISDVAYNPYHIVVSSVEDSQAYLGLGLKAINDKWASEYKLRGERRTTISGIDKYPCFIKPAEDIKAWTGIIVSNRKEADLFTNNFRGPILQQEIIDIESEYRLYVTEERILGIKHYSGDPYLTPSKDVIEQVFKSAKANLSELSYTLDFAVTSTGETALIEVNDGWAIGNYGLQPSKYYQFVKNRWLQLTGVRR